MTTVDRLVLSAGLRFLAGAAVGAALALGAAEALALNGAAPVLLAAVASPISGLPPALDSLRRLVDEYRIAFGTPEELLSRPPW